MKKIYCFAVLVLMVSAIRAQGVESAADKAGKAALVERLMTQKSYLYSHIIDKCFTFKLSSECWTRFSDPANDSKSSGFDAANYLVGSAIKFAKHEGLGDLDLLNVSGNPTQEKENRPQMDEIVNKLNAKLSMTVVAQGKCTSQASDLISRVPYEVMKTVGDGDWSPKSGEAHFTVFLSPTAKDIGVKISPDGKRFTVTSPEYEQAMSAPNKIEAGLSPANKKR